MLTKELRRELAVKVVGEHGMPMAICLKDHDFGAGNLIALLEIYAAELDGAESPDIVGIIDKRMGAGWTRTLAEALK